MPRLRIIFIRWALISLFEDRLPTLIQLADRYFAFMEIVQGFDEVPDIEGYTPPAQQSEHFAYYRNSRGASTDEPQRNNRLEALQLILVA